MDQDEKKVQGYLEDYGFVCERFSKEEMKTEKTPDFKVVKNNEFLFYCEVKSVGEDRWLDNQLDNSPPGTIVGGLRNDPIYNRLTSDIHEAIKQFDNVNGCQEFPNVLAYVNHDELCGFQDLIAIMTGNFYSNDGNSHPIYKKFSDGRIKDEKNRIHLFIWIDDFKLSRLLFNQIDSFHHLNLCGWFGIDPAGIKNIN